MPARLLADSTTVKLRHLVHLSWLLLFAVPWVTPTLAQEDAFEAYRKEVLAITSKYPAQAIPNHYAEGPEVRDANRLYAIADALSKLDSKTFPVKASKRERLSVLMKDSSPALSLLFVSHSKQPHFQTLIEEWLGRPTEAGRQNREKIESGKNEAIQILEKYASSGGPRFTRGADERAAAARLVKIGQLLHRLNPLKYSEAKEFIINVQTNIRENRPDLAEALEKLLVEQTTEALNREKLRADEAASQPDSDRVLEERPTNTEENLQVLRIQAHGVLLKYEATGGPRKAARLGEDEPSRVEKLDADFLSRISLKLHEVDPSNYGRTSGRKNLARLFKTIPGEGPALAEMLELRLTSPDFPARLEAWRKIRRETSVQLAPADAPKIATNDSLHLEPFRLEVIQILDKYRSIGRPRTASSDPSQVSDANRLVRIGLILIKKFPQQFGTLERRVALARLIEGTDPHGAEILSLEVRSTEFKEAVRLRNGLTPLSAQADQRIADYQKEVLSIFETYAKKGGPSERPSDPDSPEGKREIAAAKRLREISFRAGGLNPNRFLPNSQKENLARLVEDAPGGGQELAKVIRASRQGEEFRRLIRDWRQAKKKGTSAAKQPPERVKVDEAPQAVQANEPPSRSPEKTYPEAVRAFLDRYPSVDEILKDGLKIYREFRETGGPIEWSPAVTPGQQRERSAARMLTLLNHRLHELDPARFSDPSKLGNLARAIAKIPGEGPALAELMRTDRSKDPALHERRRKIWIAVLEEEKFINCLTNAAR
jgi:hypothetical protein